MTHAPVNNTHWYIAQTLTEFKNGETKYDGHHICIRLDEINVAAIKSMKDMAEQFRMIAEKNKHYASLFT